MSIIWVETLLLKYHLSIKVFSRKFLVRFTEIKESIIEGSSKVKPIEQRLVDFNLGLTRLLIRK